jgi:hypothetical protein
MPDAFAFLDFVDFHHRIHPPYAVPTSALLAESLTPVF